MVGEYTPVDFHPGFFRKENDNNFFLLTNLVTTMNKTAGIELSGQLNLEITLISGSGILNLNITLIPTFTDTMMVDMDFPAGEGYLFQSGTCCKIWRKAVFQRDHK